MCASISSRPDWLQTKSLHWSRLASSSISAGDWPDTEQKDERNEQSPIDKRTHPTVSLMNRSGRDISVWYKGKQKTTIAENTAVTWRFGCTHQSNPLEPLLQFFLRLTFPQHPLQPADELRRKLLRLNVNILWDPVCALMGRQCESILKVTVHN